jgi:hypothetical protein
VLIALVCVSCGIDLRCDDARAWWASGLYCRPCRERAMRAYARRARLEAEEAGT